jgi:hypothetical protein
MRAKENLFVNGLMPGTRPIRSDAGNPLLFLRFLASLRAKRGNPGVRPTPLASPKGDTPGGLYSNQLGASPIRPRLPAPSAVRMLMNRIGRDARDNRNAHFDNYKAQRSLQDTLRNWPLPSDFGGTVMYPRRFTRVRPTGRNSDLAKLIVDPKAPVIDCRVVDYSPGGACLEISGQTKLPNRFELLFGGTRKRCRIVWSAGRRLGVVF